MPDIVNPYIPGQPAESPDLFFGRREVLASIREHLLKGRRVFVATGAHRIGKTSLLWQVPSYLPDGFVSVRINLLERQFAALDQLLWRVADEIDRQVSRQQSSERLAPAWADFEGHAERLLDRFWPDLSSVLGDRVLVLLLDDLNTLDDDPPSLLDAFVGFLSNWREQDERLAIVLTTTEPYAESLLRAHPRLFGGALTYALGPLSSEEAIRLITWPVDGIITYDYGVARRLIEATSGSPYYIQLLCFELFNRCAPAGWVNQRDLDLVLEDLVGREIDDFQQVWDESSPREQAVLAALVSLRGARGVATAQDVRTVLVKAGARVERGQVTGALEDLVARDILERLGALSYRFRVALLRDWLGERIDLNRVVHTARGALSSKDRHLTPSRVAKLRTGKGPVPARKPPQKLVPEADQDEPTAVAARRPLWPWIAGGVALSLFVVMLLGAPLLAPPAATPTSAVAVATLSTQRPVTATLTRMVQTAQAVIAATATLTPAPGPSMTASPTPPVVVARSVPSIAYQSKSPEAKTWGIYVMNSDGSGAARIGDSQTGFLSPPSWSPDGSRIAFVSDRDGNQDIWVMDSDGSHPLNLTHEAAKDYSPAWSPTGDWIAFASVRDTPYWEIYLMRPDGSDVQRLTWWEDASDWSPSWSPDGTRLAFASKRDGNWEIYVMDRDGSNLVRLTDDPADDTNPAWSPDGSRIAFESTREGYTDIFVMPAAGGEAVNLTNAGWSTDLGPTWSPDGGRIGFYSDRNGDWDIYVMASDGSGTVKLTGETTNDQLPAWRP